MHHTKWGTQTNTHTHTESTYDSPTQRCPSLRVFAASSAPTITDPQLPPHSRPSSLWRESSREEIWVIVWQKEWAGWIDCIRTYHTSNYDIISLVSGHHITLPLHPLINILFPHNSSHQTIQDVFQYMKIYSVSRGSHLISRLAMRKLSLSLVFIQRSTMRLEENKRKRTNKMEEEK